MPVSHSHALKDLRSNDYPPKHMLIKWDNDKRYDKNREIGCAERSEFHARDSGVSG